MNSSLRFNFGIVVQNSGDLFAKEYRFARNNISFKIWEKLENLRQTTENI